MGTHWMSSYRQGGSWRKAPVPECLLSPRCWGVSERKLEGSRCFYEHTTWPTAHGLRDQTFARDQANVVAVALQAQRLRRTSRHSAASLLQLVE